MPRLAHHVFFTLQDRGEESKQVLLQACRTYLSDHPGLIGFEIGVRDPDLDRPVNGDFDVSLHCVFENRAAHDAYQSAPRHHQFIEETKASWAEVRVWDSLLED